MSDIIPTKPKPAGGAPTLYKPEYCQMIVEWFEARAGDDGRTLIDKSSIGEIDGKSTAKQEMRHITAELPTLEGFARSIGTHRKSLLDWSNRHEDFRAACARAKDIQCQLITDRALNGQYNAQYAQFVAKNITWMKDKVEVENVVPQDTADMTNLKQVLSSGTPAQLEEFKALLLKMQQQAKLAAPITDDM